jgi:hypothetical protein
MHQSFRRAATALALLLISAAASPRQACARSGPFVGAGRPLPDLALPDLEGKSARLSDFRGKRLLLIRFASW